MQQRNMLLEILFPINYCIVINIVVYTKFVDSNARASALTTFTWLQNSES